MLESAELVVHDVHDVHDAWIGSNDARALRRRNGASSITQGLRVELAKKNMSVHEGRRFCDD